MDGFSFSSEGTQWPLFERYFSEVKNNIVISYIRRKDSVIPVLRAISHYCFIRKLM